MTLSATTKMLAVAALGAAASAAAAATTTVHVPFRSADSGAAGVLTLAVASGSSFRLGVDLSGSAAPPTDPIPTPTVSPLLVPSPAAKPCAWGGMSGICAPFGALLASPSGAFALYDAHNATILTSGTSPPSIKSGGIALDVVSPISGAMTDLPGQPCLSNGMFGPPFAYSSTGKFLAFAVSAHLFDNRDPASTYVHCNPNTFTGVPVPKTDTCVASLRHNHTDATGFERSPTYPSGALVKSIDQCCAKCNEDTYCRAWIASADGKPDASGKNCWPGTRATGFAPADNRVFAELPAPAPAPATGPSKGEWWILADNATGARADWYLAPTATDYDFTAALYELTGAPALPPRYAFGFMATYWGYNTMEEVEGNMTRFRDLALPIDSFIMDYDWWLCGTR
jgi:hypothetical protein